MKRYRIGLLGFSQGYYATNYTAYLSRLKEVEIIGCCDFGRSDAYTLECAFVTAETFCEKLGVPLFHDMESLLALSPDAVLVCSETHEHAQHAIAAMEAGADVFIAKPASFCPEDICALIAAAQKTGKQVVSGQPLRYESAVREMQKAIADGKIGRVTHVHLQVNHTAMIHQEWERDSKRSGGPLGTFGIYLFDAISMLCGLRVRELFAYGDRLVFEQINGVDTVQVGAVLENGALASLDLISTMQWDFPFVQIQVTGEKGHIQGEYDNYSYTLVGQEGVQQGSLRTADMGMGEMEHFLACLRGEAQPEPSLEDMLYITRGIQAIQTSIDTGTHRYL